MPIPPAAFRHRPGRLRHRGASAMETVLLLAAVGLPLMVVIFFGIRILAAHYTMVTTLNALPIG